MKRGGVVQEAWVQLVREFSGKVRIVLLCLLTDKDVLELGPIVYGGLDDISSGETPAGL